MAITAMAGAVLLLGVQVTLQTADEAFEQTVAQGIARQLMDEILGHPYMHPGQSPYQTTLSRSSWEDGGAGRERYNDTDDYNGYAAQPAADIWGIELGRGDGQGGYRHPNLQVRPGYFDRWRIEVEVYYVDEHDPTKRLPDATPTNLRAADVRVLLENPDGGMRQLARLRRVYAYVPPPQ